MKVKIGELNKEEVLELFELVLIDKMTCKTSIHADNMEVPKRLLDCIAHTN